MATPLPSPRSLGHNTVTRLASVYVVALSQAFQNPFPRLLVLFLRSQYFPFSFNAVYLFEMPADRRTERRNSRPMIDIDFTLKRIFGKKTFRFTSPLPKIIYSLLLKVSV